jgi:hypothetical protein
VTITAAALAAQTFSLEELLLLNIKSLEQMRFRDQCVAHRLVEVDERVSQVLSDVFLDLAGPLGVILAVVDESVVGVEAEFHLIEDAVCLVVARLPIDGLGKGRVV